MIRLICRLLWSLRILTLLIFISHHSWTCITSPTIHGSIAYFIYLPLKFNPGDPQPVPLIPCAVRHFRFEHQGFDLKRNHNIKGQGLSDYTLLHIHSQLKNSKGGKKKRKRNIGLKIEVPSINELVGS